VTKTDQQFEDIVGKHLWGFVVGELCFAVLWYAALYECIQTPNIYWCFQLHIEKSFHDV
jgi:hypothetical protein|tara:strand:- start:102 stop:278 length:177 start_codon:yes stop_codon:yes gene_type:complete